MARITVEDCLERVPNRFSLVLLAADRAKKILDGAPPKVSNEDENKEVVLALREIAGGLVSVDVASFLEAHERSTQPGAQSIDDELPPEA